MKQVTIIFLLFSFSYLKILVAQQDSIKQNLGLKDGQTIVSASGFFELGFFSPNNSQNRFLGIWYKKISSGTVVWVANRNTPLRQKSGVLTVTPEGNLGIVVNLTNTTVWSSNSSASSGKISPVAQLLDTGNLVVKDGDEDNILWQSFDYPTDTLLPDMKFGINKTAGIDMSLTSWSSSSNDPAPGEFTYRCHPQGYPQFFITRGSDKIYRFGNWNGITFSGLRQSTIMNVTFVFTHKEVYYMYNILNNSVSTRLVLNQKGVAERQAWVDGKWDVFLKGPTDNCDYYGRCGRYGSCNIANSPICECLKEFVPKSPRDWNIGNFSNGCVREKPLDCQNGDRFLNYSNIKLPDTESCWSNETTTLKECEILCSRNCTCTGYTTLDIRKGSGCLLWFDDLIDIRQVTEGGQFIFIRMAASKLGGNKGRNKERILIYVLILPIGTLLLGLSFISYMLRKKKKRQLQRNNEGLQSDSRQLQLRESQQEDLELPLIGLGTIQKATSNFSIDNKLGEGGFGPVYKGVLEDGKEIAVKRLSKDSRQGTDEFKNEVVCIAKLQHRNLVKLIGCCIQDEEKMLIYEYMPNKGLDFFIFDETRNKLLDWPTRLSIINGIARGLLYLHQDSRLRVIHRDLKLSNILLDKDLNPKISDFGMARIFRGDETHANTLRVVGTYGYMSPEYQLDGLFSVKSDVFSFGVLVLEIASGKRNRGFVHPDHHHNLLGHAWKLFKEGTPEELIDDESGYKSHSSEILRSIHISLLCIQQNPEDRPNMSYVVTMLGSDSTLPQPKQPGFFTERNRFVSDTSTSHNSPFSCNEVTITLLQGR